jgi:hypothetical protein
VPIFISYTRKDRLAVDALTRDLERAHNEVWLDEELTGGQQWWITILSKIRSCDLFIFALSPDSLKSRACRLEFDYALDFGRPLLPVLIRDVAINSAPPAIANTQIVDYRQRTVDAGIALISAVASRPQAPPPPEPLPDPPAPPISYMQEYRDLVDAPFLTYQQQNHLLVDLRGYVSEDDDRETALDLMRALRRRRDIAESIGRDIDQLLAAQSPQQEPFQPPRSAQTPPPQPHVSWQQPPPSPPQSPPFQPPPQQQPVYQPSLQQQPVNQPLHGQAVGQPAQVPQGHHRPSSRHPWVSDVRHHRDRRRNHGRTDAARNRCAARPILRSHAGQPRSNHGLDHRRPGALYLFLAFIGFFQGASYY